MALPAPSDKVLINRDVSVQFRKPFVFAVIRVEPWATYDGWAWITGYQLDDNGVSVDRRTLFVQPDKLMKVGQFPDPARIRAAAVRNAAGARRTTPSRPPRGGTQTPRQRSPEPQQGLPR